MTCAHEVCTCEAQAGSKYCSDWCAQAGGDECHCHHDACHAPHQH